MRSTAFLRRFSTATRPPTHLRSTNAPLTPSLLSSSSHPSRSIHLTADPSRPPRHILTMTSFTAAEVLSILRLATHIRSSPLSYTSSLPNHTLLMLFNKPSLRTRLSFETASTQLGGHAIYYPIDANAPLGAKESMQDTAVVSSRYADLIMMRVKTRQEVEEFSRHSTVPVINALDDWGHPCQILADLLTLTTLHPNLLHTSPSSTTPQPSPFSHLRLAYLGDLHNNVTYDLMRATSLLGAHLSLSGPPSPHYQPHPAVLAECAELNQRTGGTVTLHARPLDAARGAAAVFTDTWQSYHLSAEKAGERRAALEGWRVTREVMEVGGKGCVFMHCLPALRGEEVEAEVIDGPQSVVYDEAENRLHAQKALMLWLLGEGKIREDHYTPQRSPAQLR